jgi:hypothetical protein
MDDESRIVSHRALNWEVHTHQALKTCTATDKITSLPAPDERQTLGLDGRVPSRGGTTGQPGAVGGGVGPSRLVSQKQLQREKNGHVAELHAKRYNLR